LYKSATLVKSRFCTKARSADKSASEASTVNRQAAFIALTACAGSVVAMPVAARTSKALPILALSGVAAGAVLVLLLQVIPPTNTISPLTRTISEYGLSANAWLFNLAVLLVAAGSVLGFAALIRGRIVTPRSPATLFATLWVVSLLVIVWFPKTNWANGPSDGGTVHRVASVVGFVCLPVAVLLAARATGRPRLTRTLAIISLLWFAVILGAVGVAMAEQTHWWELIPLGLVERLMALTELLALGSLVTPARLDMTQVTDQAGPLRVLS
jgi:hypothetical protein